MGKAAAKIKNVRLHVGTWPNLSHYLCDQEALFQPLYACQLFEKAVLACLQAHIILVTGIDNLQTKLVPKVCTLCWTLCKARYHVVRKNELRDWTVAKWHRLAPADRRDEDAAMPEPGDAMLENDCRLKGLYWGVYVRHFRNAPGGRLGRWRWWHPSSFMPPPRAARRPEAPRGGVCGNVCFAVVLLVVVAVLCFSIIAAVRLQGAHFPHAGSSDELDALQQVCAFARAKHVQMEGCAVPIAVPW